MLETENAPADIELTKNGELMVVGVVGKTDAGIEFVEAYQSADIVAVDLGWIVLPQYSVTAPGGLAAQARERGLTVEETEQ